MTRRLTFDATLLRLDAALNSFSFVWPVRFHNEQIPSTLLTQYLCFSFSLTSALQLLLLLINFGFIQIQPSHSNPQYFVFPLACCVLCSRSLAFTVSSHRALRYDLAVSCFLLTVLRHKIRWCYCCLLTAQPLCVGSSRLRGIHHTFHTFALFSLHLLPTLFFISTLFLLSVA